MKYQVVESKKFNSLGYIIQEINPDNEVVKEYPFQDKTKDRYLHVAEELQPIIGHRYIPLDNKKGRQGIIEAIQEKGYLEIIPKEYIERTNSTNAKTNESKVGTKVLYEYLTDDEKQIFEKLMKTAKERYMKDRLDMILKQKLEKAKLEYEQALEEYNKYNEGK